VNLWRVTRLKLLDALRRLNAAGRQELSEAYPRDVTVARWFVWVYGAGLALAAVVFAVYYVPATVRLVEWLLGVIAAAKIDSLEFWAALAFAAVVLSPRVLATSVVLRDLVRRRSERRRGGSANAG
jgi:hypothetical protein